MNVPPLSLSSMPSIDPALPTEAASGPAYESAMKDFEGIFISMMLKEMRKSIGGDKADAMGGLFDMTIGEELGRHGGLGITAALNRYNKVAAQTETSGPPSSPGATQ